MNEPTIPWVKNPDGVKIIDCFNLLYGGGRLPPPYPDR